MTPFNIVLRTLALSTTMACSLPLFAADSVDTEWNHVCGVAGNRELIIQKTNGDTVYGHCATIRVDSIALYTKDGRMETIGRNVLSRIHIQRQKGHQLSSLRKGLRAGLRQGSDWLLTPAAPLGLVAIPATLAWGAAAAPFCLIGDLTHRRTGQIEIKVK